MKTFILGALFALSLAYLLSQGARLYLTVPTTVTFEHDLGSPVSGDVKRLFRITREIIRQTEQVDRISDWSLSGTVTGVDAVAMLISGNDMNILRVGQQLENYTLSVIESDRAKFTSNDKDIWLYMPNAIPGQASRTAASARQQPWQGTQEVPKQKFTNLMRNPEKLMNDIFVQPRMVNGRLEGFRVGKIRDKSDLKIISGLQAGDIITGINGKKLRSTADALQQYQRIMNLNNFTLTIKRDNQERTIRYAVQ